MHINIVKCINDVSTTKQHEINTMNSIETGIVTAPDRHDWHGRQQPNQRMSHGAPTRTTTRH